ncbi:MAG: hypothetical protein LUC60_08925, partial [Lachnospiraceae bacterium]|nr:hypothetical protein [Lachnospiraceae bacterium]
ILYEENYITAEETLIETLHFSGNANIKVLGTQIYDLKSHEISLSCKEAAEQIINKCIHIIF